MFMYVCSVWYVRGYVYAQKSCLGMCPVYGDVMCSVHGYGFDVVHVYVGAWVGVGASTPCAQCRGYGRCACYSVWYVHGYGHVQ